MSNIKELVEALLRSNPEYRDDYYTLSVAVWCAQLQTNNLPLDKFLALYSTGKLISEETIQRNRRILQKQHTELRGSNYSKMQEKEKEIREKVIEGDLTSLR
jgi:hypothetical protein